MPSRTSTDENAFKHDYNSIKRKIHKDNQRFTKFITQFGQIVESSDRSAATNSELWNNLDKLYSQAKKYHKTCDENSALLHNMATSAEQGRNTGKCLVFLLRAARLISDAELSKLEEKWTELTGQPTLGDKPHNEHPKSDDPFDVTRHTLHLLLRLRSSNTPADQKQALLHIRAAVAKANDQLSRSAANREAHYRQMWSEASDIMAAHQEETAHKINALQQALVQSDALHETSIRELHQQYVEALSRTRMQLRDKLQELSAQTRSRRGSDGSVPGFAGLSMYSGTPPPRMSASSGSEFGETPRDRIVPTSAREMQKPASAHATARLLHSSSPAPSETTTDRVQQWIQQHSHPPDDFTASVTTDDRSSATDGGSVLLKSTSRFSPVQLGRLRSHNSPEPVIPLASSNSNLDSSTFNASGTTSQSNQSTTVGSAVHISASGSPANMLRKGRAHGASSVSGSISEFVGDRYSPDLTLGASLPPRKVRHSNKLESAASYSHQDWDSD
eukprot:TRINITY_DN52138_c0_g1_i1.p1 TRINITY_DN52138_c0_g1~~TRINITY_DN52138_c0_g1_i1.p1  ORF type:complete len:503 (+),score=14.04 TRINITY_DN52138_c0_g1_i1:50-1558(+)